VNGRQNLAIDFIKFDRWFIAHGLTLALVMLAWNAVPVVSRKIFYGADYAFQKPILHKVMHSIPAWGCEV
jgi:hypothetical protein